MARRARRATSRRVCPRADIGEQKVTSATNAPSRKIWRKEEKTDMSSMKADALVGRPSRPRYAIATGCTATFASMADCSSAG
jgi:hypothetical protein